MIKEEKVLVSISSVNLKYYRSRNYTCNIGDKIEVNIVDLPKKSHSKVTAICEICGSERLIAYGKYILNKDRHGYYGCRKCSRLKAKKTNVDKYGVEYYHSTDECKKRIQKTNMEKYGVKTNLLDPENIKKIKETNKRKYGSEYVLSSDEIRTKCKKTLLDKYGVDHYSKSNEFKKVQRTNPKWEKHLLDNLNSFGIGEFKLNIDDRSIDILCEDCNTYYNISYKNLYQRLHIQKSIPCTTCNPLQKPFSNAEKEICDFIKDNFTGEIITNEKKIIKGELDIYIPELNLAIEYNGVYWHSELFKDDNYHLRKTNLCYEQNIQLIHIFEDEWERKEDIVKSRILNLLSNTPNKIYARKCEIREVNDNKTIREFLNDNHIQGFVGSRVKIGLFYDNILVSLMTFGNLRKNLGNASIEGKYELLRFCNKINTNVVGGASKILKYFINKYKPESVLTYADRRWSVGSMYQQLGFDFIADTPPNYFYVMGKQRFNRFNFRKDVLVKEGYDQTLTEREIMLSRGYYRIYDCGSKKYLLSNK